MNPFDILIEKELSSPSQSRACSSSPPEPLVVRDQVDPTRERNHLIKIVKQPIRWGLNRSHALEVGKL